MNDVVVSKKGTMDVVSKTIYTVPNDRIFILVDWFVINNTASDVTDVDVRVGSQPVFPGNILTSYSKYYESRRHIELIAGDTITVCGNGNAQYFFSGIEQDASAYVSGETSPGITQEDLEAFQKQYSALEKEILGYRDTSQSALKNANESLASANSALGKANSAIEQANASNKLVDIAYEKIKGYRGTLTGDYTEIFSVSDANHFEYEIGVRLMNKVWDANYSEKNVMGKGNGYLRFLLSWNNASAALSLIPIEYFGVGGSYTIAVVRDVDNALIKVIAYTKGISVADIDVKGTNAGDGVEYTVPFTALTNTEYVNLKSNTSYSFLIEGFGETITFTAEADTTNNNELTFRRIGNKVEVIGSLQFSATESDASYELGNAGFLKSKYCPETSREFLVGSHQNGGANRSMLRLCVDTNGKVTLKPALSVNLPEGTNAVIVDGFYSLN